MAIVEVIARTSLDDLLAGVSDSTINRQLTHACRRRLRQFGVYVGRCAVTDFSACRVYKLITDAR
jgi:hypothetical protein